MPRLPPAFPRRDAAGVAAAALALGAALTLGADPGAGAAAAAPRRRGGEPVPAGGAEALAGDRVRLGDGRAVRLAGLALPGAAHGAEGEGVARAARAELAAGLGEAAGAGAGLALRVLGRDRHGELLGDLRLGGRPMAARLAGLGLAWATGDGPDAALAAELLAAEAAARAGAAGLWAAPALAERPALEVAAEPPRFAVVRGTAVRTVAREPFVYLDFGPDWRRDFSARLAAPVVRALKRAGLDPAGLPGRELRLRGWLWESAGPMIEPTGPGQLEAVSG